VLVQVGSNSSIFRHDQISSQHGLASRWDQSAETPSCGQTEEEPTETSKGGCVSNDAVRLVHFLPFTFLA